ncbi:uncharacterized protein C1orf100 homolog [Meleagris gallopavo]|uniref:uncharacterized protein C1orf100 homolog n=1 Tax=Meleagris gallopavo TaxID=9103 RepID=UPI00093A8ABF|nr:uncharacterized protein C1orf100 homolog [Meleagris gallopavo]
MEDCIFINREKTPFPYLLVSSVAEQTLLFHRANGIWDPALCLLLIPSLSWLLISLVVRPGKDVRGLYPGQVGRVHQTYVLRGAPGPFSRLQPAPVNYKAKAPFQPDFDNSALRNYVRFQKIVRKPTADWYNQTFYKAAFDLPYLKTSCENKHTPTTVPVPYTTWNRVSAQRMFSVSQVYT